MFTGIIEDIGRIYQVRRQRETIKLGIIVTNLDLATTQIGASIAVNGVCLTIVSRQGKRFIADVMPETFRITNLAKLGINDQVNLERALPVSGRFEGHIVLGHVDQTTTIVQRQQDQSAIVVTFKTPAVLYQQIVTKGSIAIDGISLTIIEANRQTFKIGLIPHSQQEATLAAKKVGNVVNLETDILGKYVVQHLKNTTKGHLVDTL
ncbi:riboflavin synthase [Loigolactobacillus iwatensis]|uniref:riboflavin synthase n=1 Tax=Loigolactobacillus iwatensis TaxID=1267156 RepID=UPI000F7ED180|nr:riboflavin synthase [Loigolactobacillus iwatensis]